MNGNSDGMERTPVEMALFAIAFFGFVIGAVGLVLRSPAIAILGFLGLGVACGGFLLRQFLGE